MKAKTLATVQELSRSLVVELGAVRCITVPKHTKQIAARLAEILAGESPRTLRRITKEASAANEQDHA